MQQTGFHPVVASVCNRNFCKSTFFEKFFGRIPDGPPGLRPPCCPPSRKSNSGLKRKEFRKTLPVPGRTLRPHRIPHREARDSDVRDRTSNPSSLRTSRSATESAPPETPTRIRSTRIHKLVFSDRRQNSCWKLRRIGRHSPIMIQTGGLLQLLR